MARLGRYRRTQTLLLDQRREFGRVRAARQAQGAQPGDLLVAGMDEGQRSPETDNQPAVARDRDVQAIPDADQGRAYRVQVPAICPGQAVELPVELPR
jgi:hypothetical protein